MDVNKDSPSYLAALRDFRQARQRALLESIAAYLTGKSVDLLSYDDVREQFKMGEPVAKGLQEIPLDAIAGSVGRTADFTRSFLPRQKSDERHWAEVKAVVTERGDIPPITVYQVDQVYFVLDGNHRVSIARQLGASHIPAYVTKIPTNVPLSPDVQPDELICKARYADFLEETGLNDLRPEADLSASAPGQYRVLKEQIEIHRRWMSDQEGREVPFDEAVGYWYDEVYLPVVRLIRERGILRHFPKRTETDLYVWLFQHQAALKETLGWQVEPESVVDDLVFRFSHKPREVLARLKEKILDAITPDPLEPGPPPGQWRTEEVAVHHHHRLFADTLCVMSHSTKETGWLAMQQALVIAQREQGRLHGLYHAGQDHPKIRDEARAAQAEFEERCRVATVEGEISLVFGNLTRTVCERARWTDLIVINPLAPPEPQPGARLGSEFGTLIRRCGRPILAVGANRSPMDRALLAYDGSPKANEALFVAAYLAARWRIPLVVLTVTEKGRAAANVLEHAREYLEAREVPATFATGQGSVVTAIQETAATHQCDFIIMGGYGFNPVLEIVLGSAVDEVVRLRRWPVLICR